MEKVRGLVVTTDETMYVKEFSYPLCESVGEVVGGWFEKVSPGGLGHPFCFLCNEEGMLKNLPINCIGSIWYRSIIVGNIVVMKLGYRNGERDIVGLEDSEISEIKARITAISSGQVKEVNPDENLS